MARERPGADDDVDGVGQVLVDVDVLAELELVFWRAHDRLAQAGA